MNNIMKNIHNLMILLIFRDLVVLRLSQNLMIFTIFRPSLSMSIRFIIIFCTYCIVPCDFPAYD